MMSFRRNAIGVKILRDRKTKPGIFHISKGFTQIDYIIATGIFLVVFAVVVQYVATYFGDITATTNIRIMTTESNDFLKLADRGFDPVNWPYFTPNDSVLLYMHLDNSTLDNSRYGNNGVEQNGVNCAANVTGRLDGACIFDGIDDFINISNSDVLNSNGTAGLTVLAWINPNDVSINKAIITKFDYNTQNAWGLQTGQSLGSGRLKVFIATSNGDNGVTNAELTNSILTTGIWQQVGFVFDGTGATNPDKLRVYVNGQNYSLSFNGVLPSSIINSTATVKIGRFGGTLTRYFNGTIDEVIIFNRSLSADEVKQLYNYETTINRLGLATKAYRFQIVVNNSRAAWKDQSKAWVNITDEQVVFNYSDFGLPASVSSTSIYDDNGNMVAYNINGNRITFNTTTAVNTTKNFTVYFDDANFLERGINVAGNDNLTETVYPYQKIDVVQYKKILFLNNSNYTLVKNTTQTPREFRLTIVDSVTGSIVIDYGAAAPPNGNIVASRRFIIYQNSTGGIRKGSLNVQVW